MLKQSDNPPMCWPVESALDELPGRWWVVHCKPRQEKSLAWDITRAGGGYFLPMYEKVLRSRGRQWRSQMVLFPGYLFFCGDEPARLSALQTDRIVRMIEVFDQRRLVAELMGIERLLTADLLVGPVAKLVKGSPCRITAGPLAGLEGVVESRRGHSRLVLMVTMLGQGAAVELDADVLEPVES